MVRSSDIRRKKYEAKMDPDAIKARFSALKEFMVAQEDVHFAGLVSIENQVKAIVEQDPDVKSWEIPQYLNVGRMVYGCMRDFTGEVLKKKLVLVYEYNTAKGLKPTLVKSIIEKISGITLPTT